MTASDINRPAAARSLRASRTIMALMLREMATTHGRSPGGYLWAILEPTAGIALLTLVFSVGFSSPALGTSFAVYYATGMIPFVAYNDIANKVAESVGFSRPLLAYPSVTFVDAIIARFLLNAATQMLISVVVIMGLLAFFDTGGLANVLLVASAMLLGMLLALGVGTLNCYLMTRFPVWRRAWSIVNRPLFIVSCVFFLFETIPEPYRGYLWYNPLVHVVGLMRRGFYPSYDAAYVSVTYVVLFSGCCLFAGLLLLWRSHRDLIND